MMTEEQYLNYLQESQHIALESYHYLAKIHDEYITSLLLEQNIDLLRDEKIDEILN